jgi:hypothetical protein
MDGASLSLAPTALPTVVKADHVWARALFILGVQGGIAPLGNSLRAERQRSLVINREGRLDR